MHYELKQRALRTVTVITAGPRVEPEEAPERKRGFFTAAAAIISAVESPPRRLLIGPKAAGYALHPRARESTPSHPMRPLLLTAAVFSGVLLPRPGLADWWVVRSSDETCLVVDVEPTPGDKGVTKIGKNRYPTAAEAEADLKRLCRGSEGGFAPGPR